MAKWKLANGVVWHGQVAISVESAFLIGWLSSLFCFYGAESWARKKRGEINRICLRCHATSICGEKIISHLPEMCIQRSICGERIKSHLLEICLLRRMCVVMRG